MIKMRAPKGTKDILPDESYRWQYVEEKIRDITRRFHFSEIRVPTFEHTELFLRGVGDTTDVVQKEMYTFNDKGDRSITLRPEGTAGVTRAFIESGMAAGSQPTKMYYLALPVFRYENPQAGRLREHHQFGVEFFGAPDASADAEIINLAWTVLRELGITKLKLNINSIGCKECRKTYNDALVAYYEQRENELCDTCKTRLHKNPLRLLDCKEEHCSELAADAPKIIDYLCDDCNSHFESLKGYLALLGIEYAVNPLIVRGLDYYTKTVFEIISDEIGAKGTVCGGGRYDGLIQELGGPDMPGVGFGMGMERLLMVLDGAGIAIGKKDELPLYICTMGEHARQHGFLMTAKLRDAGIPCDMDHCARSVKAQMKYANKSGARFTLVLGDNELENGKANLRDMKEGAEHEIELENIVGEMERYIK